jgi:hypothetical protein
MKFIIYPNIILFKFIFNFKILVYFLENKILKKEDAAKLFIENLK